MSAQDHAGPHMIIKYHTGPYETILAIKVHREHRDPKRVIQELTRLHKAKQN